MQHEVNGVRQDVARLSAHCRGLFEGKRLAIVGNQGAGKTTLGKRIVKLLGLEFVRWYS